MEDRPSATETSHESIQAVSQSHVEYLPADHDATVSDVLNIMGGATKALRRVREIIVREADDDLISKITRAGDSEMEAEIESKSADSSSGVTAVIKCLVIILAYSNCAVA